MRAERTTTQELISSGHRSAQLLLSGRTPFLSGTCWWNKAVGYWPGSHHTIYLHTITACVPLPIVGEFLPITVSVRRSFVPPPYRGCLVGLSGGVGFVIVGAPCLCPHQPTDNRSLFCCFFFLLFVCLASLSVGDAPPIIVNFHVPLLLLHILLSSSSSWSVWNR